MVYKSDAPNKENISDVVESLNQTYSVPSASDEEIEDNDELKHISDDEVKELLKAHFIGSDDKARAKADEAYSLDEDFLTEAESFAEDIEELSSEEEIIEEEVREEAKEVKEPEVDEVESDVFDFEDLPNIADIDELDEPEIDDELTFDQIEDTSAEEIEYAPIELDKHESDDVLESGEEVHGTEQEIVSMHLEREPLENPIPEAHEQSSFDAVSNGEDEVFQRIPEKAIMRQFALKVDEQSVKSIEDTKVDEPAEHNEAADDSAPDSDFLDELIGENDENKVELKADVDCAAKQELDGAEISLLMQFGCDDEIIERYNRESAKEQPEESVDTEFEDTLNENKELTKEKLLRHQEEYKNKTVGLLIRLSICAFLALMLLIFEGTAVFGSGLIGNFVVNVLICMQLAALCVLTSYKQVWDGIKKLLSPTPSAYSIVAILGTSTLIYDICIFFSGDGVFPPTFHLLLVLSIALAIVCEWRMLVTEKKNFEFFFEDYLSKDEGASSKKFTLRKSQGKNSTAEKMYKGGLDSSQSVYYPIEIDKLDKFFTAINKTSRKTRVSMLVIVPIVAISLVVGVFALIASGIFWVGVGGMNLTLLLTLPTAATISVWLPFDIFGANARKSGYTFVNEGCMEDYADGNIAVFADLHLFAKWPSSQINLAFYDGTAKDTVLACLNAVYREIGGPMADAFAAAGCKKLGECRLTRVAKSGVEAIVGSNYSVLIGSESFMARYGISFPNVILNNSEDEVHTLCVSINGRGTARIAARYAVNEQFEMFVERLAEQKIFCVIETYDPMINTELLAKLRNNASTPISVVHMSAEDNRIRRDDSIEKMLFEASEEELGLLARRSRFNLAVAMYSAKKMSALRKYCNILSLSACGLGAVLAFIMSAVGTVPEFNALFVLLYWMLVAGGVIALVINLLPKRNKFSFDAYLAEKDAANTAERNN